MIVCSRSDRNRSTSDEGTKDDHSIENPTVHYIIKQTLSNDAEREKNSLLSWPFKFWIQFFLFLNKKFLI